MIGGAQQLAAPGQSAPEAAFGADVCPADFQMQPDRETMSVDLTHAWPASAAARAVQRTVMALRREEALRLVDAFDLEKPAPVAFRFIAAQNPQRLTNGLRLGPVDMAWEGALSCDVAPVDKRLPGENGEEIPLYRVTLTTHDPVARAFFTFYFSLGGA